MRDKQTGVVRDVPSRTLQRWPEDYVPVEPETPETAEQDAPENVPATVPERPAKGKKKSGGKAKKGES